MLRDPIFLALGTYEIAVGCNGTIFMFGDAPKLKAKVEAGKKYLPWCDKTEKSAYIYLTEQ